MRLTRSLFSSELETLVAYLRQSSSQVRLEYAVPPIEPAGTPHAFFERDMPYVAGARPQIEPGLATLTHEVITQLQLAFSTGMPSPWAMQWTEKLLRVCEIRRTELRKRFGSIALDGRDARVLALRLCLLFVTCNRRLRDTRFLNVALKLMDQRWLGSFTPRVIARTCCEENVLKATLILTVEHDMTRIDLRDWSRVVEIGGNFVSSADIDTFTVARQQPRGGVVLFSPNPRSVATVCVAEGLRRQNVTIEAIVVRRVFNLKRLVHELRRDGASWVLRKFIGKFLFPNRRPVSPPSFPTLTAVADALDVAATSVPVWCAKHDVELLPCDTLNDSSVHALLRRLVPEIVVFTGGGLIHESTLALAGKGVLNCHGGLLPNYRGLDLDKWPFLENHPDLVGSASHFMTPRVDEGDILYQCRLDSKRCATVDEIGLSAECLHVRLLIFSAVRYLLGETAGKSQTREAGRQYFYMHPRLARIAHLRVAENHLDSEAMK